MGVAGAGGLVSGDAADAGLGGAGLLVIDAAVTGHAARRACAGAAAADTDVDADTGGVQGAGVLQVLGGDAAGAGELVFLVRDGLVSAGDLAADQLGLAAHFDVEAALAGIEARLDANTVVVSLDLGLGGVDVDGHHGAVADRRDADADTGPDTGLLAVVDGFVLQGLDGQVAFDVGVDGVGIGGGPAQRGVTPAFEVERAGRLGRADGDRGVVVGHLVAVGFSFAALGAGLEGQAVLAAAQREGGAQAGVGAAVGAAAGGAVAAGQQVKVAAGVQRGQAGHANQAVALAECAQAATKNVAIRQSRTRHGAAPCRLLVLFDFGKDLSVSTGREDPAGG